MWKIGFGAERLGLIALRFPVVFSILLILLSGFCASYALGLKFNGNVLAVLPERSQTLDGYFSLQKKFRNFSRDVTILVEADNLDTVEGIEMLRNTQLEVSLVEGVANVTSILSVPDFDPETGEFIDWVPLDFEDDQHVSTLLSSVIKKYPQAGSLYNVEKKVAVIIAALDVSIQDNDVNSISAFNELKQTALGSVPDGVKVSFTGLTPIGASVKSALVSDQVKLTVFGVILGSLIAFLVFKNFLAAFICAVPPVLTALWSIGMFSILEIQVTFLTTILPILALILAFADGIFMYFYWQSANAENENMLENLKASIKRVGPACALTSITTAFAFISFYYVGSKVLDEFAFMGALVVGLAFISVIVAMPLLLHWLIKFGLTRRGSVKKPSFQNFGRSWRKVSLARPKLISFIGVLLVGGLASVHTLIKPEYIVTDFVPKQDQVYYAEQLANEVIGGRSLLLVSVPFSKEGGFAVKENRDRLSQVEAILGERFERQHIFSANRVLENLQTPTAKQRVGELVVDAPPSARTDFISKDSNLALISVRTASNASVTKVGEDVDWINGALSKLPFGQSVVLTGFPVLMAVEFTGLIEHLRSSLLIAIVLGILAIGFATRSWFIMVAAITPNLLPIFAVQFVLYMQGGTLNLAQVISLVIAFGIAIDNAVHLINIYHAQISMGKDIKHALSTALEEVGPALAAGSVIICASVLVTQLSVLPVAPAMGQLTIVTLIVALISNIILLPANILTLEYIIQRWSKAKAND
ncbi:MAG: RND family transporter [Nitratireductor sp.]